MKTMLASLVVATGLVTGTPVQAHDAATDLESGALVEGHDADAAATPAQRRIEQANRSIGKAPAIAAAHVELAMALAQRARETSDHGFYDRAGEAVVRALALAPDDFEALRARAWILLGQHRFAEARKLAESLNKRVPDDVMVYGMLTDANIEMGDYKRAETACQWMLDLRPGTVPAMTRAAYLRELFGDAEGALELMGQALDATPLGETEDRAWILTQMAHLRLLTEDLTGAERLLDQALSSFPAYHYALAQLARVRAAQGRHDDAVLLLRQRYEAAPHPENLYDLAAALALAGRQEEARAAFEPFEKQALEETHGADNANRQLVFYYADHARLPEKALAVARRELEGRRDVHTLDAYAWALYRSGHIAEASVAMDQVLAVGIREASVLYHAGAIAARLGQGDAARDDAPSDEQEREEKRTEDDGEEPSGGFTERVDTSQQASHGHGQAYADLNFRHRIPSADLSVRPYGPERSARRFGSSPLHSHA